MNRTHAAAVAAALLAAVAGRAQSPDTRPDVMALSASRDGSSPHPCKVLRTYPHPAGGTAYEVRDLMTGEVMTVVENADPARLQAVVKAEAIAESKPATPRPSPRTYAPVAAPAVQPPSGYTRPPVPANRRWLGWFHPTQPAPVMTRSTQAKRPAGESLAAYDPDPVIRLIGSLHDELLPSMREVSAEALAREGRGRQEVVEALVRSAKTDMAPSVRACCCRCLAEMQAGTPECLTALQGLEADEEQSVRTAAAAARAALEQP